MGSIRYCYRLFRKEFYRIHRRISRIAIALILLIAMLYAVLCILSSDSEIIYFTSLGGEDYPLSDIVCLKYDVRDKHLSITGIIDENEYAVISAVPYRYSNGSIVEMHRNSITIIRENDSVSFESGANEMCPVCWLTEDVLLYWDLGVTDSVYYKRPDSFVLMQYNLSEQKQSIYRNKNGKTITIPNDCVPRYDMIVSDDKNSLYFFIIEVDEWSFYDWGYNIMKVSLIDNSTNKLNPWGNMTSFQIDSHEYKIWHPVGQEYNRIRLLLSNKKIG